MSQGVMWNALAAMPNPGAAFQQSFQAGMDRNKEQEKEWVQYLGNLAQWADTPEKWDQAVDHFAQQYPHAKQFKGRFELREPLMARAGIAPQKPAQPEVQKKVEYYRSIGRDDLAQKILENEAAGSQSQDPSFIREADALGVPRDRARQLWEQKQGIVVINGIPHMTVPGTQQPAPVLTDEDFMEGGGSGDSSTGNFRDPLAPL